MLGVGPGPFTLRVPAGLCGATHVGTVPRGRPGSVFVSDIVWAAQPGLGGHPDFTFH